MPTHTINGAQYHYIEQGEGAEVIFFGHGLLYHSKIFAPQMEHFASKGYRCIAIDWRGQGKTEGGGNPSDYTLYQLGHDAYDLLQALGVQQCHWAGVSMGAMTAMRLYPKHPELFKSLTIIDSSAADAPDLLEGYTQLGQAMLNYGMNDQLNQAIDAVFYTPAIHNEKPDDVAYWHEYWANANRQDLYNAVMPVIDRDDVSELVNQISVPTLIIVGDQDNSTPPAKSEDMHRRIAGSKLVYVQNGGHMSIVERPEAVTQAMDEFLSTIK